MTVGLGIKPGLLEMAVTVSVWFSLVAPEEIPARTTVCSPASSLMFRLAMGLRVGASFHGVTVSVKLWLALPPLPSLTYPLGTSVLPFPAWEVR